MNEIEERRKDISYGTHAQRTIYNYLQRQKMRNSMLELKKILTEEQRTQYADLLNIGIPHHCTLVHMTYSSRIVKAASKDYNFGQVVINKRMENGYQDVQDILVEESQWGFLPKDGESRIYKPPSNRSKLLRKLKKV